MSGPNRELEALLAIASEAAKLIMQVYARPFQVDYKAPQDPVTEADRLANDLICERLQREFPGVPIVAEESDPKTFGDYRKSERVFFVDPVDGTREFVDRNGEFAVMIGLVEQGRAVAAVIDAPARGDVFAGWVGQGAFRVREGRREPITVSSIGDVTQSRLVGSRSHRSAKLEQALAKLSPREVLVMGSAGLKGTLVASAEVEAYVAPGYAGKRWDACAADALVTAAGGKLTDTYGDAIDYRSASISNDRGLIASNGLVHDALVRGFEELR
ncbi:MAG TPA: 3'(2'),5'-bisphosphate nucleotidase CysQ [Polyangiaceae bacterium]|nr:3'(2'),5'-bisphosphate nucleotidase CysQ [Polyangiaceae bacterium]